MSGIKRDVNLGDMRHEITWQRCINAVDGSGGTMESWTDFDTVYSAVSDANWHQAQKAGADYSQSLKVFTMRYIPEVNIKEFAIIFNERRYRVLNIRVLDNRDRWMEVTATGNLIEKVT